MLSYQHGKYRVLPLELLGYRLAARQGEELDSHLAGRWSTVCLSKAAPPEAVIRVACQAPTQSSHDVVDDM